MPGSLEKISDDEIPTEDSDVRSYWRALNPLCRMFNAWLDFQVVRTSGKDALTLSDNATLELDDPPAAAGSRSNPLPFDVVAPNNAGNTSVVFGQVNPFSLFLKDEASTDTMAVTGLGSDMALSPGTLVYLQVDASDDGSDVDEVGIESNTEGFGDKRITVGGSGKDTDPYIWDQSFYPLAQVYACSGNPAHGGTIFRSGDGSAAVEVVNLCGSHLGLLRCFTGGASANRVIKTAATAG